MQKFCKGCERDLDAEKNFTKDATKTDGYHSRCRECKRSSDNESAKRQRERKKQEELAKLEAEKEQTDEDRKRAKAKERAIQRLIDNHEGEYIRLVYSELVLAGIMSPADRPRMSMQWVA